MAKREDQIDTVGAVGWEQTRAGAYQHQQNQGRGHGPESHGPKATRHLATPNFGLRYETARSQVGARSGPR